MPRGVGDDKLAVVGTEIAVGHVDSDTLLTFSLQSVQQKGIVDVLTGVAHSFAVALERIQLILIDLLAIKKQSADQGRFAIVYGASRQETQQIFLLILVQKLLYI